MNPNLSFILVFLSASIVSAQMPTALVKAEREKLLQGVASVPKAGAPGPVAVWGGLAFPFLSAPDRDGIEMAVAAAAGYGKGRLVLFGHNSYLAGGEGGYHARLIENCARWVGNKPKPSVGLRGVNAVEVFKRAGLHAEAFDKIDERSLKQHDVVVINVQGMVSMEEGQALVSYIRAGGGVIAGMTGWAFSQTSGGKDLAVSHGVNQAFMPVGMAFTDMSAFDGVRSFEARLELPAFLNASEAVAAIRRQSAGGESLSLEEMKQASSAIQIAMAAQPPGRDELQRTVLAALGGGDAKTQIPTAQVPLTTDQHAAQRLKLGMETRVLKLASGDSVAAHPAHEAFPGKVAADVSRGGGEVKVNVATPGWTSTGWYAVAGDTISITIPAAMADKGYAVRIGCHSDTLYHLDKWERAPDITRSVPLATAVTRTASAFGGLIYIVVPDRAAVAGVVDFAVRIENAVAAPLFVLGQDDDARWNTELKKRPAPWAELACDKMIVTCPSEVARTITTPTLLMNFWKKVVEAQDDICNQTAERRRPERIVADVQISAGYMHSGYPIMIPTSASLEMVTFNRLKFPGWGFYHEIGHNHQRPDFTFEGTGEVTNNVVGMYCYHEVLKKDWLIGHTAITEDQRRKHIDTIRDAKDKWSLWKSNPFLALTTYIQLVQAFGWESWRAYLHSFSDESFGPKPGNDEERRDQFLVRYSKITRKNLGPFFDFWGIPVSDSAKREVARLELWMPSGL